MRVWIPDPPKGYKYFKKIVFDIVEYDVERLALRVRVASNRGFYIVYYDVKRSALRVRVASNRKFGIGGGRPHRCWIPPESLIGAEYTILWSLFRESR